MLADPATLGLTGPNDAGRRYRHGTLSAYAAGKCRCEHCRGAYASYRAQRRAAGQDQPRARRTVVSDGHIPRWWFRAHVWLPAVEVSGLAESVTVHGLRHAHASWLLAGGADLEVVRERLGHSSIVTTQKYLGTLDGTDDTAIDAHSRIRNRGKSPVARAGGGRREPGGQADGAVASGWPPGQGFLISNQTVRVPDPSPEMDQLLDSPSTMTKPRPYRSS